VGRETVEPVYNVLLLDETNDGLAEGIGRSLLLAGRFDIHCLTESVGRLRLHRAKTTEADLSSGAALLRSVKEYVSDHHIDVVLPIQEPMLARVAEVRDELCSLAKVAPAPSAEMLARVHDKWQCRQLFIEAGIDVPSAWSLADLPTLRADLEAFREPVLLKPVLGRGGKGIQRFDSGADLLAAVDSSQIDLGGKPELWMAEELIEGTNVNVCLLAMDGDLIGTAGWRVVVSQGHAFRSAGVLLDYYGDDRLQEFARRFAVVTNWSGPADIDCRMTLDGRVKALEVNPRFWQTTLGPVSLGSNFPAATCLLAVGEEVAPLRCPTGLWLNIEGIIQDWRNVRALIPALGRSIRGAHPKLLAVDPRFELDFIRFHTARQANGRIRQLLVRLKGRRPRPREGR